MRTTTGARGRQGIKDTIAAAGDNCPLVRKSLKNFIISIQEALEKNSVARVG